MRCPNPKCAAEWKVGNVKVQQSLEKCPFCGVSLTTEKIFDSASMQDLLCSFVLKYGAAMYATDNLRAFLYEYANSFPKERNRLFIAIVAGIPKKLLKSNEKSDNEKKHVIQECLYVLTEDYGLTKKTAKEIINLLASGLGWNVNASSINESADTLSFTAKYVIDGDGNLKCAELMDIEGGKDFDDLKSVIGENFAKINNLNLNEMYDFLTSDSSEDKNSESTTRIAELEKKIDELKSKQTTLKKANSTLKNKLQKSLDRVYSLEKDLDEEKKKNDELKASKQANRIDEGEALKDFVHVTGGTVQMGNPHTNSLHTAVVDDFFICKHSVTQSEYMDVMGINPSYFPGKKLPVENVSWWDAIDYCNKLSEKKGLAPCYIFNPLSKTLTWNEDANGFRLPTEAEWEYAARGGGLQVCSYSGSNIIDEVAWFTVNSSGKTHRVMSKDPNQLGLYDMSGNVWEWCFDAYSHTEEPKVIRGGSYNSIASACSVYSREDDHSRSKKADIGFRVVLSYKSL